ncbi:CHAT domain-containing protein [uncultured Microscilla sp.]|uniref:CHAT domain-containing protein n=1 Tax=uncultured Microscilla sp. TaxID=432653 RepID=UPI002635D476|nr:CHAT domain-containing protein [uncultured Microscilla sp.]
MNKNTVIFSAFADPHENLPSLNKEKNAMQDELASLETQGVLRHFSRSGLDLPAYFEYLQNLKNQVTIFHFGGHANWQGLRLQDKAAFFYPLANELSQKNPTSLKLIFLNGCSTYAHVNALFDLGLKVVIAAKVNISDAKAAKFAQYFYKNLAKGASIQEAFASAQNFIEAAEEVSKKTRLAEAPKRWSKVEDSPHAKLEDEGFDWGLYFLDEQALNFRLVQAPNHQANGQPSVEQQAFLAEEIKIKKCLDKAKLEKALTMTQELLVKHNLYDQAYEQQVIITSGSYHSLKLNHHKGLVNENDYKQQVIDIAKVISKILEEAKEEL